MLGCSRQVGDPKDSGAPKDSEAPGECLRCPWRPKRLWLEEGKYSDTR